MMFEFPGHARDMKAGEEPQVDALLRAAFEGAGEADLVRALRKSGDIAGEVVLPMGERIIGYYALSDMIAPRGWLSLAPVAIEPEFQRRGFGKRMMGMLSAWAAAANRTVVVLGAVPFYESAGFSQARAAKLSGPYPIDHTMLAGGGEDVPEAALKYAKPFAGLD